MITSKLGINGEHYDLSTRGEHLMFYLPTSQVSQLVEILGNVVDLYPAYTSFLKKRYGSNVDGNGQTEIKIYRLREKTNVDITHFGPKNGRKIEGIANVLGIKLPQFH